MTSLKVISLLCVFASAALGTPFQPFQRHSVPASVDSTRQGRNSKLMNFGALPEEKAAAPLSLSSMMDLVNEKKEEPTTEAAVEAMLEEEEKILEDVDDVLEEVEEVLDEEEALEEAEEKAVEEVEAAVEEAEKVMEPVTENLKQLEDAVTEVLMNDLLQKSIEELEEKRGGKQHEDKIGLTHDLADERYRPLQRKRVKAQSPIFQLRQQISPVDPTVSSGAVAPEAYQYAHQVGNNPALYNPAFRQQQQFNNFQQQFPETGLYNNQHTFQYQPNLQQQQQFSRRTNGNAQPRSAQSGLPQEFGENMGEDQVANNPETNDYPNAPQLDQSEVAARQSAAADNNVTVTGDDEVRCINKVMQVEETRYKTKIKCQHSFSDKCHNTYVTDYVPTQEEKCEMTFKKNCKITYEPTVFEEDVEVCNEPLVKVCNKTIQGENVCKTHYETMCETRYKEHEVEQDEPNCQMVIEKRCDDVTVPLPTSRRRRQAGLPDLLEGEVNPNELTSDFSALQRQNPDLVSVGQQCEDWPVQKCTLEKKKVKKVNPETSCQKMPREICAPSNCEFRKQPKVCRQETRNLVSNVPSEKCDLEPQEQCKMETVLVPRLVLKEQCVKVPKEICVEAKVDPETVKIPVVKEWCYKPADLNNPKKRDALTQFFKQ